MFFQVCTFVINLTMMFTDRTPHCVIWVGCSDSTSDKWNTARIVSGADSYDINM